MLTVIAGPTACGKSAVALALARRVNGEIVSADSMQVYRGMDIGTAKPTPDELGRIPHYLVDVADPDEPFSAARYQTLAQAAIADIRARGRVPILAGGTGFYLNAVVFGTQFAGAHDAEATLRDAYTALAASTGPDHLHALLARRDPAAAAVIHPHNIKRVARALAFCENTNGLFSAHNDEQRQRRNQAIPLDTRFFVLCLPRAQLYARIDARVGEMFAAGFAEEVAALLAAGYAPTLPAMQAIGYKEIAAALADGTDPRAAAPRIAQATRNYAKRQITWFNNSTPHAHPIDASSGDAEKIANEIIAQSA